MDFIKNTIKQFFINYVMKNATVENVKQMFTDLIRFLKEKAGQTDTVIDDWFLDAIEAILTDEAKIAKIVEFIKSYLVPENTCCCMKLPQLNNYMYLVKDMYSVDDGADENVSKSIPWSVIKNTVDILAMILPYIIELINQNSKSETTETCQK